MDKASSKEETGLKLVMGKEKDYYFLKELFASQHGTREYRIDYSA